MDEKNDIFDDAFEEGVQNFNILLLEAAGSSDPVLREILRPPRAALACKDYARTRYLGMVSTEDVFERYRLLFALKDANGCRGIPGPSSVGHVRRSAHEAPHTAWMVSFGYTSGGILIRV